MNKLLFTVAALALVTLARYAPAADPVAESMFQEGLQKLKDGQYEEACRVLEASQKLEAKSGTLVLLGSCREALGRTATAWALYKEAAALARSEGRENHAAKATELAKALEPRLSMLRIDAQVMQGGVTVVVKLDGTRVVDGSLGVAFAVDPGEHTISASAPGRVDWTTTLSIAPNGDRQVVSVPQLDPLPAPPQLPPAPLAPEPTRSLPPPAPPSSSGPAVWPWIVGGFGVAALAGSAAGLGVSRLAAGELDDACGEARDACPRTFDAEGARARELGGFGAFVGLGAAGLGLVGAGILGLAFDGAPPAAPVAFIAPSGGGLSLGGRF